MNDGFVDVPIYARDSIGAGQFIMGPALIAEPNGTNVIEPGWQAEMTKIGNLVVRRVEALVPRVAIGTIVIRSCLKCLTYSCLLLSRWDTLCKIRRYR